MPGMRSELPRPDTGPRGLTPVRGKLRGFGWRPLGRRHPVISDLDLDIQPGERVLLAGPSGAGKSTVLRAFAGVLGSAIPGEATGQVEAEGQVGLLLQNPGSAMVSDRLGRDVAFGPENLSVPRDEIWSRVRSALDSVAMPYGADHPTHALSGGELQRLALAGVLALRPGLLLLDEPTSMLDEANAERVRRAILDVVGQTGSTLILAEHRIAPWLTGVDRLVVLDSGGAVIGDGAPAQMLAQHGQALVEHGVWVPGFDVPAPTAIPDALVQPAGPPTQLYAEGLSIDLTTRTLHGPLTTRAVNGVDTKLTSGTGTAFTGPSGAGKSTLLAAFGGLVRPSEGRIAGLARPLHRWPSRDLAGLVGWVPQNPEHGFLTSRVRDEITHTGHRLGVNVDTDAILDLFELTRLAEANPFQLSGGEQRRLGMAAALAHRPGVQLLDEPTVGQDRQTWAAVAGWIAAAARTGAAVATSTHDQDLISRIEVEVRLRDGRLTP